MEKQARIILLILDNAPSHNKHLDWSNIKILSNHPSTSILIQPLDQGVIRVTKNRYKEYLNTIYC